MTMADVFDVIVAATVLIVASWSVMVRRSFTAIVAFIAFGLMVALLWVRLAAVDVALTEAAIGGGLTGLLLLTAAARRQRAGIKVLESPGAAMRLAAALLCLAVFLALAVAVLTLPRSAPTLAPQAMAKLAAFDIKNPVTAVLLGYRALDTLLETMVVLLALIGVWSVAPERFWGGRPARLQPARPDEALIHLGRLLPPVGLMVVIYIVWVGTDEPGGKFQGAAILAAMWLLVMMAGLRDLPAVGRTGLRLLLIAGPVLFFAIGLAGFAIAGNFLAYPVSHAKLLILLIELVLTPSVAIMLGLLVAGPPMRVLRP
jgi:multisubunit Na+/H+ antiporter MnhB subunit